MHPSGYNWLGPLTNWQNDPDYKKKFPPTNRLDYYAMIHDEEYGQIISALSYHDAYIRYNAADDKFINNVKAYMYSDEITSSQYKKARLAVRIFETKKRIMDAWGSGEQVPHHILTSKGSEEEWAVGEKRSPDYGSLGARLGKLHYKVAKKDRNEPIKIAEDQGDDDSPMDSVTAVGQYGVIGPRRSFTGTDNDIHPTTHKIDGKRHTMWTDWWPFFDLCHVVNHK